MASCVFSEQNSKFSFRWDLHHVLHCKNQSSSHISATISIIAKSQDSFYKGWISRLKWFCDYKAQDRKVESGECRTSGKHVFLSVVTYKRQKEIFTSSDTLNLFRRATNFCLKLGCYRENIERICHQKCLGCNCSMQSRSQLQRSMVHRT